jgi:hypothetical protein
MTVMSLIALVAAATLAASPPASEPPRNAERTGPPPASLSTEDGKRRWLDTGSYCWASRGQAVCVDKIPSRGRALRIPAGETVTFHLGFRPRSVRLATGRGSVRLPARRKPTYRIHEDDRFLSLFVRGGGGDVSYAGDLLGPPPAVGIDPHPPAAFVEFERGASWMATGAFCWKDACASGARMDIGPRLPLRVGEVVRMRVAFRATAAKMHTARGATKLEPGRVLRYRVRRGDRYLNVALRRGGGDSVSYGVRLAG